MTLLGDKPLPDILYDGIVDVEGRRRRSARPTWRIRIRDNGDADFVDFDLPRLDLSDPVATKTGKIGRDLKPFEGDGHSQARARDDRRRQVTMSIGTRSAWATTRADDVHRSIVPLAGIRGFPPSCLARRLAGVVALGRVVLRAPRGCGTSRRKAAAAPPEKLSAYGLFAGNGSTQEPAEGVIPYDLNSPLFSDYATSIAS